MFGKWYEDFFIVTFAIPLCQEIKYLRIAGLLQGWEVFLHVDKLGLMLFVVGTAAVFATTAVQPAPAFGSQSP